MDLTCPQCTSSGFAALGILCAAAIEAAKIRNRVINIIFLMILIALLSFHSENAHSHLGKNSME
jgi:hypothetical protein